MTRDFKKNFIIDLAFVLIIAGLIYFSFRFLMVYLFPFLIGLIITAIVQKPSAFISSKIKIKKGICALILVIATYVVLGLLIFFCGYELVDFITSFVNGLPKFASYLEEVFNTINDKLSGVISTLPDEAKNSFGSALSDLLGTITTEVTTFLSSLAARAATQAPGILISVIVTIVASCYIAKDFDTVKSFANKSITGKPRHILITAKNIVIEKVLKIVKGYLILMVITFAELTVGLLLLGIDNAVLIALLIAILDLLPVLGTGTVLIPWGIINLILGNYLLGFALLILYVVVLIIRNVIEPKVIGKQVGLHPLITLLAIFTGLRLFGVVGMLAVPLAIILIYNFYKEGELNFLQPNKE